MRRRNIVWTLVPIAMLLLSLVMVAKENEEVSGYTCSPAKVAGTWGYSETGTVYISGVAMPYASLGQYTLDADGNLSGARTAILGSNTTPMTATIKGTATVNPDCTGTETLFFYNGTTLIGTASKNVVFVDQAREARKILIPGAVPGVLITEAKKLSPGHGSKVEQ